MTCSIILKIAYKIRAKNHFNVHFNIYIYILAIKIKTISIICTDSVQFMITVDARFSI